MPGFFSRLFTKASSSLATVQTRQATLYGGSAPLEVVGESRRQDELWKIVGGRTKERIRFDIHAVLLPEPDNPQDRNAIAVLVDGYHVGYLSREDAAKYIGGLHDLMARSSNGLVALSGVVVGGGRRDDGIGFLGVFLNHDPADFGLRARPSPSRAGASSEDDAAAIERLRARLDEVTAPLDRHYAYAEIERHLYRCRSTVDGALDEFDQTCERHHAEMPLIRPALLESFGSIPTIEMYKQSAIRWEKAKKWVSVERWATRGLAVYGHDAHRPENIDDLTTRLTRAQAKQ